MKTTRRALALLLAAVTLFSLFSFSALAAEPPTPVLVEATSPTPANTTGVYSYMVDTDGDGYAEVSGIPNVSAVTYLTSCISSNVVSGSGNVAKFNEPWATPIYLCINNSASAVRTVPGGNDTVTEEDGRQYRLFNGIKYYSKDMVLGLKAVKFANGFSVLPSISSDTEQYALFDVTGNNRFYAVAGITGSAFQSTHANGGNAVTYEVWGSTSNNIDANDISFVKLAESVSILNSNTVEFDVDITGVCTLKLVTRAVTSKNGTNSLWGNPCVYTLPAADAKVDVKVTLQWNDGGIGGHSAQNVQLMAGESAVGEPVTLSEGVSWTHTWTNLPKFGDGGTAIQYSVQTTAPQGYLLTVQDGDEGIILTNTLATEYEATVSWNDGDASDRPGSVSLQLLRGSTAEGSPAELTQTGSWKKTWSNIPKYNAGGTEIVWSVQASAPSGYIAEVSGSAVKLTRATSFQTAVSWVDDNDAASKRPASLAVQLQTQAGSVGEAVSLQGTSGWTHRWTNLPQYDALGAEISYSTAVTPPAGYSIKTEDNGARITALYQYTSFTASIDWQGDSGKESGRPSAINVQLKINGTGSVQEGHIVPLTKDNGWQYTWSDLPRLDDSNNTYTYGAVVQQYNQYELSVDETNGSITSTLKGGSVEYQETTDFSVEVNWVHNANPAENQPGSTTVLLYADNAPCSFVTLTSTSWNYIWRGLPKNNDSGEEISYRVAQAQKPAGYEEGVAGGIITNTWSPPPSPQTTSVATTVRWEHGDNAVGDRPDSAVVLLYADGAAKTFAVLNSTNVWSHTWENLPERAEGSGNLIVYTVAQASVPANYTESVGLDGTTFTNTYVPASVTPGPEQKAAYTASQDGSYGGVKKAKDGVVTYLSDLSYIKTENTSTNKFGKDTIYSGTTKIKIGAAGTTFDKGLGVHPKAPATVPPAFTTYDLSNQDATRFYAAVGITNANGQANGLQVVYMVYGDKGSGFQLLAQSAVITGKESGEFDVDITGVKTLKLEIVCVSASNASGASAWANACVYTYDANGAAPGEGGSNQPDPGDSLQKAAYTAAADGKYAFVSKASGGKVFYLSDMTFKSAANGASNKPTTLDQPYGDTGKIIIGTSNIAFDKGLGVHPKAPGAADPSCTIYDLTGLDVDRFFAAVGLTNESGRSGKADAQVVYKVYGDNGDGIFRLLAQSDTILLKTSGELNVDISGMKRLKLEIVCVGASNTSCGSAWAGACVYKYDANGSAPEAIFSNGADDGTALQTGAYTAVTEAKYGFVSKADGGQVLYLSDMAYKEAWNSSKSDNTTKDEPYGGSGKITIGDPNAAFDKGLGVHPKSASAATPAYTTYDVSGLGADRFYAAVGLTNEKGRSGDADAQVIFKVYGDKGDGVYRLLAQSDVISRKISGELNVDITGVKMLKLEIVCAGDSNASSASAWAGACVYKYSENGTAPANIITLSGGGAKTSNWLGYAFGGYAGSSGEKYAGVPVDFLTAVIYLSDLTYLEASNTTNDAWPKGQPTTLNMPYNSTGTFTIGEDETTFFMGLGVHPKDPKKPVDGSIESWTVYDVGELDCDRFYAAVGLANSSAKKNSQGVVFRVYGEYGDSAYKLLAQSDTVVGVKSGEFDVDITGVKTLRLAVISAGTSHASSSSAWANACIYSTANPKPLELPSQPVPLAGSPEGGQDAAPDTVPNEPAAIADSQDDVVPFGVIAGVVGVVMAAIVTVTVILIRRRNKKFS